MLISTGIELVTFFSLGGKVPVVDLHTQICRLIEQSPVGDILKQYSQSASSTVDLLANLYLHDFTKMSYTPKCIEEQEYSVCGNRYCSSMNYTFCFS